MTGFKADLPDANVWLALTVSDHRHHTAAQTWVTERKNLPLVFCRVTQMALLRLLTTPAVMGDQICSQKDAWKIHDAAMSRPGTHLMSDPPKPEAVWRARTSRPHPAPKMWTDMYLAAFAHGHNLRLVTFDKAFRQLSEIESLVL